jgi:translation initiation factor 1A
MPNFKGGKKYKSSKHGESDAIFHEIDVNEGQMVGRVIKNLGDRNMLLYCNDGKERMAHIRGGLRKKNANIEIGDLVLFSLRGDGLRIGLGSQSSSKERGDILAKYEREVYGQLKKYPGINPKLFNAIEKMDLEQRNNGEDDFGFVFDSGQGNESDESGEEGEDKGARAAKKLSEDRKRSLARSLKQSQPVDNYEGAGISGGAVVGKGGDGGDSDVDVDAI